MTKVLITILITASTFIGKAQYNDIKINVFGAVIPALNLTYQRTISKNFTAALGIDIGRYSYTETTGLGITYAQYSYGLAGDFRAYLSKKKHAPEGFFTGVHIRDFIVEENESDNIATSNVFNAGINFGYQWIWGNFTMEIIGGYGFSKALKLDPVRDKFDQSDLDDLDDFGMARFQFCIGYVFPYFSE